MKEPTKIKLTDNPKNKSVKLTPLPSNSFLEEENISDNKLEDKNENNRKNNSESISELESM